MGHLMRWPHKTIMSQALYMYKEGATTIPKGSTLKWVEKQCLMLGMSDDIVSSARRLAAEPSCADGSGME